MRRWTSKRRQATDRPPVVTNTTPLITLAGIGLLDLLPLLYDEVWAPRIVLDEYLAKASPTEADLAQASWLTVVDAIIIDPTLPLLDVGEAAALPLAQTIGARLILLDERKARRIAARMGLQVIDRFLSKVKLSQSVHTWINYAHDLQEDYTLFAEGDSVRGSMHP